MEENKQENKYRGLIIALSIVIPLAVAALFKVKIPGYDFTFLPPIYAGINGLTAILLVIAVRAIKNGNRALHQKLMKTCMGLSAAFLVMYILYHMTTDSTPYGGTGFMKTVYLIILASHIVLSVAVIPLVLFSFVRALSERFDRHRKLAKITFPIWLYVAVTGVIIYLMISPYYAH
jgi:putative membrane protein